MHFQRQDLAGTNYNWMTDQKHLFTGQPTRRAFDRLNGDQVLFLINFYGSLAERFSLQEGKEIEQKIQDELPLEARSEIAVFNWIRNVVFKLQ